MYDPVTIGFVIKENEVEHRLNVLFVLIDLINNRGCF